MSQNPAKTQIRVFDGTLKRCWSFPPILQTKPHPKPTKGPQVVAITMQNDDQQITSRS